MDSIGDLLSTYNMAVPDEVTAIKDYIAKEFDEEARVGIQGETLVITVHSASLANALRLRQVAMQRAVHTTKRLLFRIG